MAEGLSLEDAQQAEDNFYNSKYFTEQYEQLKEERATAAKHKDAIIDLLRDKENLMLSDTVVAELEEVRGRMAGLMGIGDPHTISRKEDAAGNSLWKGHHRNRPPRSRCRWCRNRPRGSSKTRNRTHSRISPTI
jgi:hypothetical protein